MGKAREIGAGLRLLVNALVKRRSPLIVGWAITNRCNLRCEYCCWPQNPSEEVDTPTALDLVAQMRRAGTAHIVFSGGEPLLRDDLGEILTACREQKITTAVDTNGLLVEKRLPWLKGVRRIQVSLDGPQQVHDQLRGSGSFEGAIQAIRLCREKNIPTSINTTVTRHNLESVPWLLDFARQQETIVDFQPVSDVHAPQAIIESLLPPDDAYRAVINDLIDRKRKKEPISNSMACLNHLKEFPKPTSIPCAAGRVITRIDPEGRLFPCNQMRTQQAWPNAVTLGFQKAFETLPEVGCRHCWCSATVELNLIASFRWNTMANAALGLLGKKR